MQSRSPFEDLEHFAPAPARSDDPTVDLADDLDGRRRIRFGADWIKPFVSGALLVTVVGGAIAVIATDRDVVRPAPSKPISAGTRPDVDASDPETASVDRGSFGYRTGSGAARRPRKPKSRWDRSKIRLSAIAPVTDAPAAATTIADPAEKPSARPKRPAPVVPDRPLYHLYSYRLEDHYFTTDKSAMKRKDGWSYDVVAVEGLIFDAQARGTKALTTPEGTVGYVWRSKRQGALALYWFFGPEGEYFTTSDAMATELSDEPGWESRGIAGYVAPAS